MIQQKTHEVTKVLALFVTIIKAWKQKKIPDICSPRLSPTIIKPAGTNTSLSSTPTAHLLQSLLYSLFLKPLTFLASSSMMLPLLPFFSAISYRPATACWSPEVAEVVAKRRRAFARAHYSEEDCHSYIFLYKGISRL